MAQEQVSVLIVGAGGAGLSLALLLRQQGIASLLIERRTDVSWYPRARTLNFRTMEVFRSLGLDEQVRAAGAPISRMFRKHTLAASDQEELLNPTTLVEHLEEISPYPLGRYCPQSRLEPLLRGEAERQGVDVRYGTELVSFTQDETGVTALLRDRATSNISRVKAAYLIAADGAHSRIREALGISTWGVGELPESQIFVYFRANWGELIQGYEADAILTSNESGRGMFLITDQDRGMFAITYNPMRGESAQDYPIERCQKLIRAALGKPEIDVEIVDLADWRPIQRVAERFQEGRVFLVGDAAHTMPPYLGLGVNTAIQSAQNMAWKLAAVLKRQATSQLLTTYQTERHPVGTLVAEQSMTGPAAVLFEKEMRGNAQLHLKDPLPILYPIVGYRYRSAAILSEETATASPNEFELLESLELHGLPGSRVPHVWIERQGQRMSTLDLFDGRFVLLTGAGGTAWNKAAATIASRLGIELAAYCFGPEADLLTLDTTWEARLGISSEGAMLLRPDSFVAWRSTSLSANPLETLERVVAHILGKNKTPSYHA
ncbi:FAD-dependent monooxygenase [Dictyobacter aurantiacus]|uniref:FAD-binding monooxygenase n=1 Tax=Dictyobacter aurantiacus TaxID=1936993 RepID=A0A401ZTE4_9CHLR|nr:FAD-dependent monooxygenase [Dictyobacter aurantiacus]GCE10044.1 FAD-binding monooxygenase [Dictyobacter aurantiacus]